MKQNKRDVMNKKECLIRLSGEVQVAVFKLLWKKKIMRSRDIIKELKIISGTISKALKSLIEKGFVEKVACGLYKISDNVTK